MNKFICFIFLLVMGLCACSTTEDRLQYGIHCHNDYVNVDLTDTVFTLSQITDFFESGCYKTVITVGSDLRRVRHDKTYQLSAEAVEIFAPEGSLTPYTLESHERTFLTVLMAASYYQLGDPEKAQVEMRKAYELSQALIYNYGDDLVLTVLQASIWEKLGQEEYAEPMWRRSLQLARKKSPEYEFIKWRLENLEKSGPIIDWSVFSFNQFPQLDWKMNLTSRHGSYYDLNISSPFPIACSNSKTLVIPTSTWLHKIEKRYEHSYHPLLNIKSWVRLPVAMGYGLITGAAGAGVGFAGCYAAAAAGGNNSGDLCAWSIQAGAEIASQAPKLVDYTLRPDLRHWENAPGGFVITTTNPSAKNDSCGWTYESATLQKIF